MDSSLNDSNTTLLQHYNKFFTNYINSVIKELQEDQQEMESTLIIDNIYNQEDVIEITKQITKSMMDSINQSISKLQKMNLVYLQLTLQQVQNKNVQIYVDVDQVQDYDKINNIDNVLFKKSNSKILPNLQANHQQEVKIQELENELKALKLKNQSLMKDVTNINDGSNNNFQLLQVENQRLQEEIKQLQEQNDKKISESVQVTNLKKMLQQKNNVILELQTLLQSLEKP